MRPYPAPSCWLALTSQPPNACYPNLLPLESCHGNDHGADLFVSLMQVRNKTAPEIIFTTFYINISITPNVSLGTQSSTDSHHAWAPPQLLSACPPTCFRTPRQNFPICRRKGPYKDNYRPIRETPTLSILFLHLGLYGRLQRLSNVDTSFARVAATRPQ